MGSGKRRMKIMNRRSLLLITLFIAAVGILFGGVMYWALKWIAELYDQSVNLSLCIIAGVVVLLFLWTPLFVAGNQVYDITKNSIRIMPNYPSLKKWNIIGYILCNNTIEPFIRVINLQDIQSGIFGVERHVGLYGLSRYTFILKLLMDKEELMIDINPMDNGILLPSGRGGIIWTGFKKREEIMNMISFLNAYGIKIEDPYGILEAFKVQDQEIYDYLETLQIKIKY